MSTKNILFSVPESCTEEASIGFPCNQCEYVAKNKPTLYRHKGKIHKNIRHPCNQCEYVATFSNTLRRHIRTVHEGNGSKKTKRKISSSDVMISEEKVGQFSSLKEEFEVDERSDELDTLFTNTKTEDKTVEESTTSLDNFLSADGESLPGGIKMLTKSLSILTKLPVH